VFGRRFVGRVRTRAGVDFVDEVCVFPLSRISSRTRAMSSVAMRCCRYRWSTQVESSTRRPPTNRYEISPKVSFSTIASQRPCSTSLAMQRLRLLQRAKKIDVKAAELAGIAFHDLVFERCGNPLVGETAARIHDQVQLARRSSYEYASDDWTRRGVDEHLHIAEAIADRDSAEAERLMKAHISAWSRHFREELPTEGSSSLGSAG
jgi:FCD domain-containing protein